MTTQQTINSAVPAHTPQAPTDSAAISRQAIYPGSERTSHRGFSNTRRRLTRSLCGHAPPIQGRRMGLRSDSIPLNSTNWVVVAHGSALGGMAQTSILRLFYVSL